MSIVLSLQHSQCIVFETWQWNTLWL